MVSAMLFSNFNTRFMKVTIELNLPDDRTFLNYWDYKHGNDVVAQIIDGKIMLSVHSEGKEEEELKEVTFMEFIELVVESAMKE
jgi:hypothetical protein